MIYELLITSVKRALQAGRSGFAPVMRTRGIHPDLQSRLEALSGYRHDFTQGDPRNSVLLSHSVIESTAGKFSVLSRIVDAGSDHSGRSNKLAHHLAFDGTELRSATGSSPAATLIAIERSGIFATQWDSEPNEKNPGQSVDFPPTEPTQCKTWARYAGDAGWAGVLIDRAIRGQPTWIICSRGTAMLPLFAEAMALVEPARRWGISFTTHAITTTGFLWMVAVDGSPEAQNAQAQNRLLVIDITKPCKTPDAGPYAQAARGLADVPWKSRTIPAESQAVNTPIAGVVQAHGQPTAWPANIKTDSNRSAPLLRAAPPGLVVPPTIGPAARIQKPEQELRVLVTRRPRKALALLAAVSFLVLLLGTMLLVYQQYPIIKERVVAFLDKAAADKAAADKAAADKAATDPSATDPSATDPSATDPSATDPSATDPSATDPSATDPSATDPSATDPSATDPSATDPSATDPSATDPSATDPVAADKADNVPPVLASLEILLPAGGQPARIRATFTDVANQTNEVFKKRTQDATLQIIEIPAKYPLKGRPENRTLIFDIPPELTPDKFTALSKGTITYKNPTTENHPSTSLITISSGTTQDNIIKFSTDQLETKSILGVKNVTPLNSNEPCDLLTFHPNAKDVQLILLTPKQAKPAMNGTNALRLIKDDGKQKWVFKDDTTPEETNSFAIDTTNPWSPKLQFEPGTSKQLGQLPNCKLAILVGQKERPTCVAVLQLFKPEPNDFVFTEIITKDKKQQLTTSPRKASNLYPEEAQSEYIDNNTQIRLVAKNEKTPTWLVFSGGSSSRVPGVQYQCHVNTGKLRLIKIKTDIFFPFGSTDLNTENKDELEPYLLNIKLALKKPALIKDCLDIESMRSGLGKLRTASKPIEANKGPKPQVTDDNKANDQQAVQFLKDIDEQIENLTKLEDIINAHKAFIKELLAASFHTNVSWDVEPADADKKSVGTLTEEQKKVYAVVPEQKQSQ